MSGLIPVNQPDIGPEELKLVTDAVTSGWISSSGRYIEEFENGWARICNRQHGVAVANGTVALQLAVAALDLEPGSEIVMPSFTIMSCALAALYNDCIPVFVDADPETWCMDVSQAEGLCGSKVAAIMPVHIYGHPVDMDPVLELAEERALFVVEDAAEAHGARYRSSDGTDRVAGSMGDVSIFSFYANKLVTTGEGGMLVTDDAEFAGRARSLRNLAFEPGRRFLHHSLGFNFRITNVQAALGVAQLGRFDEIVERKRAIGARYTDVLSEVPGLQLPVERPWATNVYWMYGVVLEDGVDLDATALAAALAQRGIETRPFFLGLHEQPVLRDLGSGRNGDFPVTERLARRGLYLPSGLALTDAQIDRVCDSLAEVLRG